MTIRFMICNSAVERYAAYTSRSLLMESSQVSETPSLPHQSFVLFCCKS